MSPEELAQESLPGSTRRDRTFLAVTWLPGLLHLGLIGLLLAEIGIVRERFDTDRFLGDDRAWARLLLETRYAAPVGIATLAAWLLLAWKSVACEYGRLARNAQTAASSALWFGLHLAVFGGFQWLTERTFVSFDGGGSPAALALVLVWGFGVLAVPLSAAAVAFPPRALGASLRRLFPSFLVATGIGVGAFGLGRVALDSGLWLPLLSGTTELARWILGAVTGELAAVEAVEGEGFRLSVGSFQVLITRNCSGFEGIALTWTFLTSYFVWFRRSLRFPHVLLLVPVATLLVWLLNGIRLAALVWIGDRLSPEVALQGFHSYAGWIAFCGLSLAVVYASRRIDWFATEPQSTNRVRNSGTVNPAAVYLGPFLGILGTSFVTGAISSGFDVFQPMRVVVGASLLWCLRSELPRARLGGSRIGLLYGGAAFVVWIALERMGVQVRESDAARGLAELSPMAARAWLVFRALGFLLVAPLAEELAFRGFLTRRLVTSDFESLSYRAITPLAWVLSSLAFGVLHGQWIAGTLAGALYGLAVMQRGRLGDAIVAHVTTNALLLFSSLVFGPWHGWL